MAARFTFTVLGAGSGYVLPAVDSLTGWMPDPELLEGLKRPRLASQVRAYAEVAPTPHTSWEDAVLEAHALSPGRQEAIRLAAAKAEGFAQHGLEHALDFWSSRFHLRNFGGPGAGTAVNGGLKALNRDKLLLANVERTYEHEHSNGNCYGSRISLVALSARAHQLAVALERTTKPTRVVEHQDLARVWAGMNTELRFAARTIAENELRTPGRVHWLTRSRRNAASVRALENRGFVAVQSRGGGDIDFTVPETSQLLRMLAEVDPSFAEMLLLEVD